MKKIFFLYFLYLISPLSLKAEGLGNANLGTISLDEAIAHTLKNHPRMSLATNDIERIRASKGEIWDVGNTSFEFSYGQLNGSFSKDHEFSLTQPLGSPITPYYKNALLKTRVSNAEHYRNIVARELTAEVRRSYANYQYAHALLTLYTQQLQIANQIRDAVRLQHEQGDISSAERNMINTQTSDIHTRHIHARQQLQLAQRQFAWSCYAQHAIPADTLQTAFSLTRAGAAAISSPSKLLSPDWQLFFDGQIEEKKRAYKLEKAKYFPELSIGWNNQRIEALKGLNSFTVGVAFPLVFSPQRSRVRQARYEWENAVQTAAYKNLELANKAEELRIQLIQQKEQLDYLNTVALPEAEALQKSAMLQFREGDTDRLQLMRDILSVIDMKEKYIETLHLYNITVIEIQLYTEQ
ncbi:MAG: TolC family protein [Bacteroidaceae bacterium]|nr:TolC family protein [Bacteroidaceae bacterium]